MTTAQSSLLDMGRRAQASGMVQDAERLYRQAIAAAPLDPNPCRALANLLRATRRSNEAVLLLTGAVRQMMGNAGLHGDLGLALSDLGRFGEAAESFKTVINLAPRSVPGYVFLAQAYQHQDEMHPALDTLKKGLEISPGNPQLEALVGKVYNELSARDLAIPYLKRALERLPKGPEWGEIAGSLGTALAFEEQYDEAIVWLRRAREAKPDMKWTAAEEYKALEHQGRRDEAKALLDELLRSGQAHSDLAIVRAGAAEDQGDVPATCAILEEVMGMPGLTPIGAAGVAMRLGGYYEKLGRFDEAFGMYLRGKATYSKPFNPEMHCRRVDAVIECFSPGRIRALPRGRVQTELPTFIVGMPRSGTSLTEQILSCLPGLFGAGELMATSFVARELGRASNAPNGAVGPGLTPEQIDAQANWYLDYVRARAQRAFPGRSFERITNKMPQNFLLVGVIGLVFPGARVIHCARNAIDTCLSCFKTPFTHPFPWASSLENLGHYYLQYHRIVEHWKAVRDELGIRFFEMPYEDLTADQEAWSRRLVDFIGLPWDDGCLKFYESERRTKTASVEQVKKPMYRSSVSAAKKFGRHLDPLRRVLAPILPPEEQVGAS